MLHGCAVAKKGLSNLGKVTQHAHSPAYNAVVLNLQLQYFASIKVHKLQHIGVYKLQTTDTQRPVGMQRANANA